jgi:hypothetical protein
MEKNDIPSQDKLPFKEAVDQIAKSELPASEKNKNIGLLREAYRSTSYNNDINYDPDYPKKKDL